MSSPVSAIGATAAAPAAPSRAHVPAGAATLSVPLPAAQLPDAFRLAQQGRLPGVGNPGTPSGPWTPDYAQAVYQAKVALEAIDWSKRDIYIWVPGSGEAGVHDAFAAAVNELSARHRDLSLVGMGYPASWDLRGSVATGIVTLKLILQGIAERGGGHRVLLAGESQGAWVIGEALADARLGATITRAVLFGHPALARHHYPAAASDAAHGARALEINNPGDHVAMPVAGDPTVAMEAMEAIYQKRFLELGTIVQAAMNNPAQALRLGVTALRALLPKGVIVDPHDYSNQMAMAVAYLRSGTLPANP